MPDQIIRAFRTSSNHHVLRQDAPALTSSPLDHLVDDRDREHDHDHAGCQSGEERVAPPKAGVGEIRHGATDQRGQRDRREDSRLSQIGLDRPRTSRTRTVTLHCAGAYCVLGVDDVRRTRRVRELAGRLLEG
jgi:hypothetical protein